MAKYSKFNGRRKPEMLAPDTFSLVNYREAETVVADWQALARKAKDVNAMLPTAARERIIAMSGTMPEPPATSWIGSVCSERQTNQPPIGPRTSKGSPIASSCVR